jgi:predicted CXXCH cytochrome family protein
MDAATFVGEEMCAGCHSDVAEQFGYSMHARLKEWEVRGEFSKCESCHGPGSKHVEESGDPQYIFSFDGKEAQEASRACVGCHYEDTAGMWPGSVHMMGGLGCSQCHTIHQSKQVVVQTAKPLIGTATHNPEMGTMGALKQGPPKMASLTKPEPELCFECHNEKRAMMNYSSHHPIIERRMKCSSCHAVHGSDAEYLIANSDGQRELCTSCHAQYSGPFVFEHAAVEEGCTTCHEPHGTLANNLLRQNEPFVCLQCHEAHFHIGRDGIDTPIDRATGSVSNQYGSSGWRIGFTTKCSNCHQMVHGSDLPSQSTSSRGGSLTR